MHKLEKLILEAYGQLLTEMDGGRLFDYFNNKGYKISERSSDGGVPGFEGYMVSKGESRSPQAVIFQHNKDTDEFTISRMSGYRIDQDEAMKAGMREKSSSAVAGIDGYMTDGNYTPVSISVEDLKDIVDHVMTGIEREAQAQYDFYTKRGPVSGTIDEALSYAFSEYNFTIEDDAYQAEVEAKIKKELKEIPKKDLQAIIKNAENYFANEARKEEKANRKPRKIKSTEFAEFAADYYTEEYYPKNYGKDYPNKRPVSEPASDDKQKLKSFDGIDVPSTPEEREIRRRSKLRLKHGYAAYFIRSKDLPKDLFYSMPKDEFDKTFGRIVDEPIQDELIDGNIDILFDKPVNEERQLVHVYDKDGSIYGTGEVVGVDKDKTIVRFDGHTVKRFPDERVKPVMEDKDDESFDLEKEFEDNPKLTKFKDLPADMQKKFSKEIKVFGKNAPGDPNRDYVDADYETYYFTTSYNKETGSVGHRLVKLPSYSKLYNSFVKIIKDIKTLMGVDAVKNDAAAKEIFENIKTLFRQLQRYLRTNHPKQYDLMKMRRMAEGLKKAKTILEKLDYNDPVLIKSRVAKMRADDLKKLDAYRKSPEGRAAARAQASAERKEAKGRELVRKLKIKRAQVMRDMENDPDIEPTGGPVADMYGDELNKIDNAIEKAASLYNKNINLSYDQAVGKINEFIGGDTEKRLSALFDKLVPGSGDSDTVEGEIIRAINRIIYRWGNDGDRFWFGYGAETAGPPMEYLTDASDIPLEIRNKFKAWENDNFGKDYGKKELEDLAQIALQYVEMKVRENDLSQNNDGIFNYGQKYIDHVRDMEDEEDEYDDYYDDYDEDEDEDYYNEDKGEKISKSNMDGYKKGNISLAESLLDDIKEQEEPEPEEEGDDEAPKETVLEDATDQILSKFPTLKAAIIKLQTEDFKEFVDTIDWISPRPTEFRVNLKNGQEYILKWTGKTFEAQIMGKRYYIDKIDDYQQALDKLAILYKEGPMSGAGEGDAADAGGLGGDTGGGGGGDFPGDDAGGGGGGLGDDDAGGGLGDEAPADDAGGGADLTGEPVDFEEPAEDPAA